MLLIAVVRILAPMGNTAGARGTPGISCGDPLNEQTNFSRPKLPCLADGVYRDERKDKGSSRLY